MSKTLCFTGHRKVPGRGYGEWAGIGKALFSAIDAAYKNGFRTFICGGAIGFDTEAAYAVLASMETRPDMRLVMAIPFKNQPSAWPATAQDEYHTLLLQAHEVVYTDEEKGLDNVGEYAVHKMYIRNRYMVDRSDVVVAGMCESSTSGTQHCIDYAKIKKIPVLVIDPITLKKRWIM